VAKKRKRTDSPEEGSGQRDFIAIAKAYAAKAVANECGTFGKWIRLAAQRFLTDLDRAK